MPNDVIESALKAAKNYLQREKRSLLPQQWEKREEKMLQKVTAAITAGRWMPIATFSGPDYEEVDLWLSVYPSPRSMGIGDSFRVVEAYRKKGRWVHRQDFQEKELFADYITHWMPIPAGPNEQKGAAQ